MLFELKYLFKTIYLSCNISKMMKGNALLEKLCMKFYNLNITVKYMTSQTNSQILVSRVVRTSSEVHQYFQQEIVKSFAMQLCIHSMDHRL